LHTDSFYIPAGAAVRRRVLIAGGAVMLLVAGANVSAADALQVLSYPTAPVKIVVPWPVQGGADQIGRLIAKYLDATFRQRVTVENRPGGGAVVGTDAVSKAAPDGHTLLVGATDTHIVAPLLPGARIPFRGIADFEPVALLAYSSIALAVHPSVNAYSVDDLVRLARASPGSPLRFATSGAGTRGYLLTALLKQRAGLEFAEYDYAGANAAAFAVAGGQADAVFSSYAGMASPIQSGKLRLLAVASRHSRPGAPALGEWLADFQLDLYFGLFAPKGTPREIVDRLNQHVHRALEQPGTRKRLLSLGLEPELGSPAAFVRLLEIDAVRWARALAGAKVVLE